MTIKQLQVQLSIIRYIYTHEEFQILTFSSNQFSFQKLPDDLFLINGEYECGWYGFIKFLYSHVDNFELEWVSRYMAFEDNVLYCLAS